MKRLVGVLLGAAIAAIGVGGCLAGPYRAHHYGGSYNRPYDDDYDYRPPSHHQSDHGGYELPTIVCASEDGRSKRCHTDFPIERAQVDKRYSRSPCDYGRSWGYDGNEVWVDRGCRARFVLTPAGRWR
jgi:hypothetical protein